jgi:hypothetical protein
LPDPNINFDFGQHPYTPPVRYALP